MLNRDFLGSSFLKFRQAVYKGLDPRSIDELLDLIVRYYNECRRLHYSVLRCKLGIFFGIYEDVVDVL